MAIFDRGYRPYEGTFTRRPGWWVIAREGWSRARGNLGVKLIGMFVLLLLAGHVVFVSVSLGLAEQAKQATGGLIGGGDFGELSEATLLQAHRTYSEITTFLTLLACVFVGCTLISDDIRSRALTLYLVRPLGRLDYVIGKALVIPVVFLILGFLPSLLLWLAVGLWQAPGETMAFYAGSTDFLERVWDYYLLGAASMTGLMLLVGSLTPRRGVALSVAASWLILGGIPAALGSRMPGMAGKIVGALGLPRDLLRDIRVSDGWQRGKRWIPDPEGIWIVCIGLLILGMVAVIWRTRSVEVSE